jgi:biotin carboxylase
MQLPAIRAAQSRGWSALVADANTACPGSAIADEFHNVDLVDLEGLVALARELQARFRLRGVFTAGTDFSTSVAYVAESCGLPGIPYQTALRATDKLRMRRSFAEAGVPSPRFVELETGGDRRRALDNLGLPVVVKPVDNMGARGVRLVRDETELEAACEAAIARSRSGRAIIEQYMEGPELSLDALVSGGTITICGVADRIICFSPFFVEMGHTMPTALTEKDRIAVEEVFARGIRALGIENGAAKGDLKLTPSGPMVGEIAARLSGGYMSGWTYPLASGVDLTGAALEIAVGRGPGSLAPRWSRVSVERALISMPGTVDRLEGVEDARSAGGVEELFILRSAGDRVSFPTNNVEKCGNVITVAQSRDEAVAAAGRALRSILVRLVPNNRETENFIAEARWPAFDLEMEQNSTELRNMPRGAGSGEPVGVLPLPALEEEHCRDWYGSTLLEAALAALQMAGSQFRRRGGRLLGRRFWDALLTGGVQGGVYALDTERARG